MYGILNISEATTLAVHAMTFLAAQDPDRPVSTKEIAEIMAVSDNHLSKVVQRLVRAGLARAQRGPKGGVLLARDSKDISLLEVYEAIEGRLEITKCLLKTRLCKPGECIFGDLLPKITGEVKDYMEKTHLSDLKHVFAGVKLAS